MQGYVIMENITKLPKSRILVSFITARKYQIK